MKIRPVGTELLYGDSQTGKRTGRQILGSYIILFEILVTIL
jgi:hypothetical protein